MSDAEPKTARAPLSANEIAFLGCTILFWAAFVIVLGKDTSWDFRNYHWYGPYALFNHRLGFDVAVAHLASWYNPYLDIPFYWLATHTHTWIALAVLGAAQGANVVPLYLIGRESLRIADFKLGAGALAILGQAGALTLTEFGTTYYDNVMSVFVFSGLAILILNRETLRAGSLRKTALLSLAAGLITGAAMGLKLPEMPFCIGFAAALVALGGGWKHQGVRLLAGGIGGVAGFALFSGPWMLEMWHLTGNPLFPYFNEYWKSPLALSYSYRDLRFVPVHFWRQILFPFYFSIDFHVTDDLGFQDIRVLIAYVTVIGASLLLLLRRQSREPFVPVSVCLPLFAFAAAAYVEWLRMFAIYRYIVALEMLAPILILAAIGLVPASRRARLIGLGVLTFAILVTARSDFLEHTPADDPYLQVALPPIPRPGHTMVVMTGDAPLAFIVTALPPAIAVLRIDGYAVGSKEHSGLAQGMHARIERHLAAGGDLFLIADSTEMVRARDALKDYRLAISGLECQQFDTNLVGTYEWCPVSRMP